MVQFGSQFGSMTSSEARAAEGIAHRRAGSNGIFGSELMQNEVLHENVLAAISRADPANYATTFNLQVTYFEADSGRTVPHGWTVPENRE